MPIEADAPKASKGVRSRVALEWQMMWRQGGKITFGIFVMALAGLAWLLLIRGVARMPERLGLYMIGLAVYLGTLQTLSQAGRAARSDLMARPFLSALPLLPHQVLEGKARALRWLALPVFAMLALVAVVSAWHGASTVAYRAGLAIVSLYRLDSRSHRVSYSGSAYRHRRGQASSSSRLSCYDRCSRPCSLRTIGSRASRSSPWSR